MKQRISLVRALASAVAFLPRGLVGASLPLAVGAAMMTVLLAAPTLKLPSDSGAAVVLAAVAILLVAALMATGALYRLALRRPGAGLLGLQWTSVEWRIIGTSILVFLLQVLLMAVFGSVLLLLIKLAGGHPRVAAEMAKGWLNDPASVLRIAPDRGSLTTLVGAVVYAGLIMIVHARLALYLAVSVAETRVSATDSWILTRGATLKMLLGVVLTTAPNWGWDVGASFCSLDVGLISRTVGVALDPVWVTAAAEALLKFVLTPLLVVGFQARAYLDATYREPIALDPA